MEAHSNSIKTITTVEYTFADGVHYQVNPLRGKGDYGAFTKNHKQALPMSKAMAEACVELARKNGKSSARVVELSFNCVGR